MKRKINKINHINLIFNTCLDKDIQNKRLFTFIEVKTNDDILIYDLSNGIDYSNTKDKKLAYIPEVTKVHNFYEYENNYLNVEMEFGPISTIKLYKNARLSGVNGIPLQNFKSNIIEFKDIYNNCFFVLYHINQLFINNGNYKIHNKYEKKPITLFEKGKNNIIDYKIFNSYLFDLSKLIFDYV